ncbi:protein KRI1 homolog [Anopheles maculipalpis]|uniref:protein KRI1 homolog n=1 Tax=Anopheles maculipalpis TaxID=1496333 RepID=UPI0021598675|nr:protein KRI1 homolog [Anopheles maculipalpis]
MGDKLKLFDESDHEAESDEGELRTNASYAKHYDEFRKKEILGQLKNLKEELGSSDSSDDETTDDEIVDPDFDKEFFRTLAFLKRKDKDKYTERQTFFENVKPIEEVALTKRHHKEKPMTVKDYERKVMLERGGVFEDENEDGPIRVRSGSPTMVEEEKKIKDEIKQALSRIGDEESDDEEVLQGKGGGLLQQRVKSAAETEKEQSDYIEWLADKKAQEPPSEDVKVLEPLKHFWSNEKLSKEDAFLKDYILNKRFVQSSGEVPTYDEIVATSEDEEELEKQEDYERKYNFRFEEPDADFIKQYPRTVEDSLRVERNKRKEQRQVLKERKEKLKEQQKRELEELKAIKLREIREKIERLKKIAATENLAMNEEDLESDFDPDEHDRRMKAMFNDEYYGVDEGDQKPEFPELDQELGVENYDVERLDDEYVEDDYGPHCEDDDFVMDCEYEEKMKEAKHAKDAHQKELLEATVGKGKKKGRRQSKFREALKAEKPLFDPEDEKTYGEYIDEYYKLDYEDMIGDTPCRFRYVETVPNDFGLSVEEILAANTRDLNKWASVKKAVQLRPKHVELNEIEMYRRRAANEKMKRKLLPSLYAEHEEDQLDEEIRDNKKKIEIVEPKAVTNGAELKIKQEKDTDSVPVKKKKVKKEKLSNTENGSGSVPTEEDAGMSIKTENKGEEKSTPKNKKKKNKKQTPGNVKSQEANPTGSWKVTDMKANSEKSIEKSTNFPKAQHNAKYEQKRKWEKMGDESKTNEQRNGGTKKPRFEDAASNSGHKWHGNNAGGRKKEENAIDQRLRAFGLNPNKFRNKHTYNRSQSQQNGKKVNKITKFE